MNKRNLILIPAWLGLACVLPSPTLKADAAAPGTSRPNIIYILADDLGYGDLMCYNPQSKIPTPNLDRLASEGIRFTDAHAPAALCTPTRYGILTGRYCFRSRLKSGVLRPWDTPLIEEGRLTVPALLRQNGYMTACIGKWHLGWTWPTKDGLPPQSTNGMGNLDFNKPITDGPTTRGFEMYFGTDVPNYPPYCFIENDRTLSMPTVPAVLSKGNINHPGPALPGWNLTNIMPGLTARTVRYVEDAAKASPAKPFFLYFPLTAPHYPIVPTAEFKGRSQAGDYGDYVAQVDATVGAVLAALERTGQATNTLVFFTSDNGPECLNIDPGAYVRIQQFGHRSMGGLRGVKRNAWEGGRRVPFIARWPERIPANKVSDETICHVDLMATCAALLGRSLPADAGEDSYNILPALLGEPCDRPIRAATVLHSGSGKFAIRKGDWVFIDAPVTWDENHKHGEPDWLKEERGYKTDSLPGQLYNLREDLAQQRNLYGEKPELVKQLKALLDKYRTSGRSAPLRSRTRVGAMATGTNATTTGQKPTFANVSYGSDPKQVLDFWKAESSKPTPLLFYIHGGGWRQGDKSRVYMMGISNFLTAGISVASIEYRFVQQAQAAGVKPPVSWPLHDAARALQFVRSKAVEWNIDKTRVAASGSSAGACSSLWLAFHDDLADPKSSDPVARESTRLLCTGVTVAQTTLDPQQMKDWTPNSFYGGHAFGFVGDTNNRALIFQTFLQGRETILPWIKEYSPYELATADDPPIYMIYKAPPALGQNQADPTHSANFGVKLQEKLRAIGVECELVYPGAPDVKHRHVQDFLIEKLKAGK